MDNALKPIIVDIFWGDKRCRINSDKPPISSSQLSSFLIWNNAPNCFMKSNGYWYKITRKSVLRVSRTLYLLSLREWLEIAFNDNFIPNIK